MLLKKGAGFLKEQCWSSIWLALSVHHQCF